MIKMKKSRFVLLIIGIIAASAVASAGIFIAFSDSTEPERPGMEKVEEMQARYGKLYEIQKTIEEDCLWETDRDAQMDLLYQTLMKDLDDPYSVYMSPEEYREFKQQIEGTVTGVGLVFRADQDGEYVVTEVINGGPADSAGLRAGDVLLKVDGKTYDVINDLAEAVRGEEGTSVDITYRRGDKTKTVTIVRAVVEQTTVYASMLDQDYGYLRVTMFEGNTGEQLKRELAEMENKGVKGLIIDLRDNSGGLLDQGISVADQLLPECTITMTEDRDGERKYYNSDESCTSLRYVLLVNEKSASASEIVAAAVQDNAGGTIVGTKTFGKGIIQSITELEDGSAIKLTVLQYLSPKEKEIHGKGIKPDVEVEQPKKGNTDRQLQKALEILKKK